MADGMKVTLTGAWQAFQAAMDPVKFHARLERNVGIASRRIGHQFQSVARRAIRDGRYAPNSPITVILKGSSRPLVADGDLFQALTWENPDPFTVRMGVHKARSGAELVNIGIVLHEGATIDVGKHPQVRRKVWSMVSKKMRGRMSGASKKSILGAAATLGQSKGAGAKDIWTIPPRPFIIYPIETSSFQAFMRKTYASAVKASFTGG